MVRRAACVAFGKFGVDAKTREECLVECIFAPEGGCVEAAATSLQQVGGASAASLRSLVFHFNSSDPAVRCAAATALGICDVNHVAKERLQYVAKSDFDLRTQVAATIALSKWGDYPQAAVDHAIYQLKNGKAAQQDEAFKNLALLGPLALKAAPALLEFASALCDDPRAKNRARPTNEIDVLSTLVRLGSPSFPLLTKAMKSHPKALIRRILAEEMAADAPLIDTELDEILAQMAARDSDAKVRATAAFALSKRK